jgi:tetratricopeptide (TPR) repeat protein
MVKQLFLFISFFLLAISACAQTAESVYDDYLNFNLARLQGEKEKWPALIARLIPNADKLQEKARTNFYYAIGKIYEDRSDYINAEVYYLKVAQLQPDYYVVQRGLGYIYFDKLKDIEEKMNTETKDMHRNQQLFEQYKIAAKKALNYLEKAEACDPDPNTRTIINLLYKNIKDTKGLNSLDARLKLLSGHCIDLLPE